MRFNKYISKIMELFLATLFNNKAISKGIKINALEILILGVFSLPRTREECPEFSSATFVRRQFAWLREEFESQT